MNRVVLVILGAVIVFVLVATLALMALRTPVTEATLAIYRKNLDNADPRLRVDAAVHVLRTDPMDQPARLAYASGLIELGRYATARDSLNALAQNQKAAGRPAALLLVAESYLAQAEEIVVEAGRLGADLLTGKVDPLLIEASAIQAALGDHPETAVDRAMIQARVHDVRATILEVQYHGYEMDLIKARAAMREDQVHVAGVQANELRRRMDAEHQQIEEATQAAIKANAVDARPHAMRFRMWMRVGDVEKAREAAGAMANQPALERALAGRVALTMLEQESTSGREVTFADQRLAEALLGHRNITGPQSVHFDLARAELALRKESYADAESMASSVLSQYRDHPVALSQWARALIGQGRASDAARQLVPVNERVASPLMRYVLGAAYMKSGDTKSAREVLRQALEQQPELLPARLLLAESMVEGGFIFEAEPDILTAAAMSPDHPRVISLSARLLIEKLDGPGLMAMWQRYLDSRKALDARDIAMAAGMVLDDLPTVAGISTAMLENDGTNLAGVVAQRWVRSTPRQRFFIASIVVTGCHDLLLADPMERALPPRIDILDMASQTGIRPASTGAGGSAQAEDRDSSRNTPAAEYDPRRRGNAPKPDPTSLHRSWFLPWPQEAALDMVTSALDRWPQDVALRQQATLLAWMLGRKEVALAHLDHWRNLAPQDPDVGLATDTINVAKSPQLIGSGRTAFADERAVLNDWIYLAQAANGGNQAAISEAMQLLLSRHPWCEPAVLMPVRRAMAAGDPLEARGYVELARSVNPQLASLCLARFDLAVGKPLDALHAAEMTISAEPGGSELRGLAGELRGRANMATGQVEIAAGAFENLALSTPHRQVQMQIAVLDVYLAAGRTPAASATITTTLADPRTTSLQMDGLLARATLIMPPDRLLTLCDNLLRYRPDEDVLVAYKVQTLIDTGQMPEAAATLRSLAARRGDSPRVLVLQGRLASRRGDVPMAMEAYQQLLRQGGSAAEAALRELENLQNIAPPVTAPPVSAAVKPPNVEARP